MKTILVAGSKYLKCNAEEERVLAEKIGAAVVKEPGWRLLTGGAHGRGCEEGKGGVDYHAALGARKAILNPSIEGEKILTLHPGNNRTDLFEIGSVIRSHARTSLARRHELVFRSDCAVIIEGHEGSGQIIEYCIAAGRPVLPLACTGGSSHRVWEPAEHRQELLDLLGLPDPSQEVQMIERGLDTSDALVDTCIEIIRRLLLPTCFVVMPFALAHSDSLWSDILKPAIESVSMAPIRGDLVPNVGPILEDITKCIAEASMLIVDITGTNPNVMYELGYAHALRKPTVLVYNVDAVGPLDGDLPFDIRGMRMIPFRLESREEFFQEVTSLLRELSKR